MPKDAAPPRAIDPRVQRALEFLEAHMAEKIDLKRLGREVGLSVPHLSRLFRAQMGVSPGATLKRMRMKAAAEMLVSDRCPAVKEVAYEVGYSSISHFTTEFERWYAVTAAEFQRVSLLTGNTEQTHALLSPPRPDERFRQPMIVLGKRKSFRNGLETPIIVSDR